MPSATSTTSKALANAFLENLQALGVNIQKMRGQGYDGASNMSGKQKGVQARIQAIVARAVYTHCKAHFLNLSIMHAYDSMHAKNMMAIVLTIAFAFDYSAKQLLRFYENLETDALGTEEMGKRTIIAMSSRSALHASIDSNSGMVFLYNITGEDIPP